MTLPGSGREIALREIDVFAVESVEGGPCLTEYPLFPGAPPAPQPPPAVPGYVPVAGYEPLPYKNCNCGPAGFAAKANNRLGPGPEKQAPIGESKLADGTVLVADPSYSTPERCAEFCSATPGCKAFGIWTGTPGVAPGCSYGPWSINPTVYGSGDGTECLCIPFVAKCTSSCTAPTAVAGGYTNLLYNLVAAPPSPPPPHAPCVARLSTADGTFEALSSVASGSDSVCRAPCGGDANANVGFQIEGGWRQAANTADSWKCPVSTAGTRT